MLKSRLIPRLLRWTEGKRYQYLRYARRACEFIGVNGVEGDLLEFGVSKGGSLLLLEQTADEILLRRWNRQYRIFGFDSFAGLPETVGSDRRVHGEPASGALQLKKGMYRASKREVEERISREARNPDSIELVEGWFEEVLEPGLRDRLGLEQVSLAVMDADFYEPTWLALDWIEPLIRDVTIIAFDDWFLYKGDARLGQRLAFAEFLDRHADLEATEFFGYSWHAKSFLVHRRADSGT